MGPLKQRISALVVLSGNEGAGGPEKNQKKKQRSKGRKGGESDPACYKSERCSASTNLKTARAKKGGRKTERRGL